MAPYDPVALECLTAVVEEGSFERAAKRQLVTQSAVSQRLSALEAQVGQPLIVRTKPIEPTAVGRVLLQHARKLRALRVDLGQHLQQLPTFGAASCGYNDHISIAVDADSMATWLAPALGGAGNKNYLLEIMADNPCQTTLRLREGRVHACVTTVREPPPRCQSIPLGYWDYIAVAQADFAARRCPTGLGLNNFRELPFIALNRQDGIPTQFVSHALGLRDVRLNQLFVPGPQERLSLLLAGWGVGVVPRAMVIEQIARGALVDIAPRHAMPLQMYWHCLPLESEVFSSLSDTVVAAASEFLSTALPCPAFGYQEALLQPG
ncbi:MAG: ArgP/LysG family DNA-binding transcriptional regulator [Rhodoferax sp.]